MISVIVPVYNTECYLRKCLDSIVNQTYKDIEVIVINDGSKDSSAEIADEYAKQYENVFVFHQENRGLIATRKRGIELAAGEYITFVDSDDWIEKDCYESMLNGVDDSCQIDMITAGMCFEWHDHKKYLFDGTEEGIYCREQIKIKIVPKMVYDEELQTPGITASLCNKLIRRTFLKEAVKTLPNDITYGEDGAVVYTVIPRIRAMKVLKYCGYHYMQNNDSMIHTYAENSFERISVLKKFMESEIDNTEQQGILKEQIISYTDAFLSEAIKGVYNYDKRIYLFPFHTVFQGSKVIIYGAGCVGQSYVKCLQDEKYAKVVAWVDKNYANIKHGNVEAPEAIKDKTYDYVIIAIENEDIAVKIREYLKELRVCEEQVVWSKPTYLGWSQII